MKDKSYIIYIEQMHISLNVCIFKLIDRYIRHLLYYNIVLNIFNSLKIQNESKEILYPKYMHISFKTLIPLRSLHHLIG